MGLLERLQKLNMEPYSKEEFLQNQIDSYNNSIGNLTDYNCPDCKNKGYIAAGREDEMVLLECACMPIRRNTKRIDQSGLKQLLADYTFETYVTKQPWQERIKLMAENFITDNFGKWFFIGGQVGCGKTHLCTAIVSEFLSAGMPAKYMLWRDEIVPLKAKVTDDSAYEKAIGELKKVKVLYIDDFFKTEHGKNPTTADINIAFEILNYRYNNRDLITIISSEKTMSELIDIDEATGSRIYQRTKEYCANVARDKSKNYRLAV